MNRRTFLKAMTATAVLGGCAAGGIWSFFRQMKFGALPAGEAMQRILASPHYADGAFHNLVPRAILSDDSSFAFALLRSLVAKRINPVPPGPVPSKHISLHALDRSQDTVLWLGHSSFFIQLGGRRLLIDPVFSPYAAPVSFSTQAFAGATPYSAHDMPDIDCLLISHDHWDHLDYPSVMQLKSKIRNIICGLGVGAHFRRWGFSSSVIHEADWGDMLPLGAELRIHVTTASHYSGRSLTRNKTLWSGFLLESPARKIFFSGDSGYGPHFAELGKRFGGVDLALLDCGQYNERWRYIHMTPEETAQAAENLGAKYLLPAHVGKFALAYHSWDEPFKRIVAASRGKTFLLITPVIGDPVNLTGRIFDYPYWWEQLNKGL